MNKWRFKAILGENGKSIKDVADALGCCTSTVYDKIKHDGFTVKEVKILIEKFGMDIDVFMKEII